MWDSSGNTATLNFVRVGKLVCITLPAFTFTAGATATTFSAPNATVPTRLLPPTADAVNMCVVVNGSVNLLQDFRITTAGSVIVQRILDAFSSFGSTNSIGVGYSAMVVYQLM